MGGNNFKSLILMTNVSTFYGGQIECGGLDASHDHNEAHKFHVPLHLLFFQVAYNWIGILFFLGKFGLGSLSLCSSFHVDIDQYHPKLIWHNCTQKMLDCAYQTCLKILPIIFKMNFIFVSPVQSSSLKRARYLLGLEL